MSSGLETGAVTEYWERIAAKWSLVGPPLRPSGEDTSFYERAIRLAPQTDQPLRGLILGVTPELYQLNWPAGFEVRGVDGTPNMIAAVWPGRRGEAVCGDWTSLPLRDSSCAVALLDGGFAMVPYPDGMAAIVRSVRRVLVPKGIFALRLFVPPREHESRDDVVRDMVAGRISSLDIAKLRLWTALQESPEKGTELHEVWRVICEGRPESEELARLYGWDPARISAIEAYRDRSARYHFVDVPTAERLFCNEPGGFEQVMWGHPTYEQGEQCALVAFRRV